MELVIDSHNAETYAELIGKVGGVIGEKCQIKDFS